MEDSMETYQALDPRGYISKFTSSNTRPSSRPHHTARRTTLLPQVLPRNTHGSSLTTIGSTQVITGITLQIGTPPSLSLPSRNMLTPQGEIDVQVSFSPLCGGQYTAHGRVQSGKTEGGGSSTLSSISYSDPQSMESYIKRTILHSDVFDLTQLCVNTTNTNTNTNTNNNSNNGSSSSSSASAWKVIVHCMVVNHDGNVVDACILGIMTALQDLKLPPVVSVPSEVNPKEEVVRILPSDNSNHNTNDYDNTNTNSNNDADVDVDVDVDVNARPQRRRGKSLTFSKMAVPLTVALFDNKLLVDPTLEEENVSDGMITIVVDSMSVIEDEETKALNGTILSLAKSGGGAIISGEEIAACVQLAFGRAKELTCIMNP